MGLDLPGSEHLGPIGMDTMEPSWVKGVEKAAPLLRVSVWLQCLPLALGLVSGFSECCCETCEVSGFTDTSQVLSLRCQAALAHLGDQPEAGTSHLALLALSGVSGRGWVFAWGVSSALGWSSVHVSCRLDRPGVHG